MNNFDDLFNGTNEFEVGADSKEYEPFDKEAWAAKKQAQRDEAFSFIDSTLEKVSGDGGAFQQYLDVQSQFDRYTVGNALLVTAQMPQATRLADYDYWKDAGTSVKRDESGIVILAPGNEYTKEDGGTGVGMNTKYVFDISQTSAKPIENNIPRDERKLMNALIKSAPCKMEITEQLPDGTGARYNEQEKAIYVKQGMSADEIFRCLSQEIVHAKLAGNDTTRSDNAFTAYAASYILCKRSGFETNTFSFEKLPEAYARMEPKEVRASLDKIRDCANEITSDMKRTLEAQNKNRNRSDDAR